MILISDYIFLCCIFPNDDILKLVWDDDEERRYREWLHSFDVHRNSTQGTL